MEGLLPDEFPFSSRRRTNPTAAAAADAPPAKVTDMVRFGAPSTSAQTSAATAAADSSATATAPGTATSAMSVSMMATLADLAEIAGYKGPERRRALRQPLRAQAIFRGDLNPAGAGPVQLLNISLCGTRLMSPKPAKLGERGTVKIEVGPIRWSSRVKVIACDAKEGEGYVIGCEFAGCEGKRRVA
jgi:hypothetical protein